MPGPDSPRESDTERDGFLSYAAEWHALTHGIYAGLRSRRPAPGPLPDNPDVEAEPHYYKGGYIIGTLLQVLVLAALAYLGVGVV
ncbi:hypothetical protein M197_gp33 [Haloarcula hispanica tailed virus 2]|uniref:Uncharacterized protein n=1 Tax=Haloarcula hispanica tailed virus 2 TaxID=1273751 RepID=R4TM07_9CAUD|nr:hypothetical protein M197_gp33 [Haloarcula hispanica tailed virus 2]AGM11198.1 hypothetical protein HHTV2_33 [Haloarcula hispanica tailed virus 2]